MTALSNGNYVVGSPNWNGGLGAATWESGSSAASGTVSSANSLVGSSYTDAVGNGVTALSNGNYVVNSPYWNDPPAPQRGGAGRPGSAARSPAPTASSAPTVTTRSAIAWPHWPTATTWSASPYWIKSITNGQNGLGYGAATWGSGTAGVRGTISSANSLVGSEYGDGVGSGGVAVLANGNYVVCSPNWNASPNGPYGYGSYGLGYGAATWGSGTAGVHGTISSANSLVGSNYGDEAGSGGATPLANGNYVVSSPNWNGNIGAATWGSGTAGVAGTISSANSLVGSNAGDEVGQRVTALSNGNYVVVSLGWRNGAATSAGAATWGSGTVGVAGAVSSANSLVGLAGNAGLQTVVADSVNGTFYASFDAEAGTTLSGGSYGGRVRIGSQTAPLFAEPALASQSFASQTGQTVPLGPILNGTLDTGAAVTLQASNDITISSPITAYNPGGNGGNLTLQAGRNLLLNSSITTGNGNLTLTANDTVADGVVNADRDSGSAAITMAGGTTLNVGTGTLTVNLRNSTDKTYNAGGVATLQNVTAASTVLGAGTVLDDGTINGAVSVNSGAALGGAGNVDRHG